MIIERVIPSYHGNRSKNILLCYCYEALELEQNISTSVCFYRSGD
jgi:hypothetical protein